MRSDGGVSDGARTVDRLWHLRSSVIDELVRAPDQFAAWDTLRDRPIEDFGLIVSAEPDENEDDTVFIRTAALMFAWGREEDAALAVKVAVDQGLPDTSDIDRTLTLP